VKRIVVKMEEVGREPNREEPFARYILDYMRATVLCDNLQGVVAALEVLKRNPNFEIARVKDRLFEADDQNRILLVNLVVKVPARAQIKPPVRDMFRPGWWEYQPMRMMAEVQIAVREMFYLDKQFRSAYEIIRCPSFRDFSVSLEADPSSIVSEEVDYPLGLLYGDPHFAF